jgi:lantibiotic transport system permease protein
VTASFLHAFHGEWLKRKRSFASSMIVAGSLFTPAIVAVVRLTQYRNLGPIYAADAFWPNMWRACWESMAVFFLPLGAILAASLITQIEFKSNAWKQVHTLPVSTTVIFLSKLTVILVMMVLFLVLFTLGIYVSGMIPCLLVPGIPRPKGSFLSLPLWKDNALYFVHCLPIVAAQYLLALRSHNALVPIGVGFMAWVGALAAISSRFAIWWPYSYTMILYLRDRPKGAHLAAYGELHWLALIVFLVLTIAGYALFATRAERG